MFITHLPADLVWLNDIDIYQTLDTYARIDNRKEPEWSKNGTANGSFASSESHRCVVYRCCATEASAAIVILLVTATYVQARVHEQTCTLVFSPQVISLLASYIISTINKPMVTPVC